MKLKPIVAAMPIMFALLTGCNTLESSTHNAPVFGPLFHHHHHHHQMQASTNGEIIANVIKIDESEIKMAQLAKHASNCPRVRHFANTMLTDHQKNLREVRRISRDIKAAPTMNPTATRISEKSAEKYAKLKMLRGKEFNRTYIEMMEHCHRHALDMLNRAIVDSTDPKLTEFLKATHKAVTMHLREAEALEKACSMR